MTLCRLPTTKRDFSPLSNICSKFQPRVFNTQLTSNHPESVKKHLKKLPELSKSVKKPLKKSPQLSRLWTLKWIDSNHVKSTPLQEGVGLPAEVLPEIEPQLRRQYEEYYLERKCLDKFLALFEEGWHSAN
uniref:Uncharacterized protein n=1 Tax=Hyaloperonospora arabidopsidis (strain Emoy2) TaxID=559515 RepID=M4BU38_HYAAE